MPSPPDKKTDQTTIPVGLVFLTIGMVIILVVLLVWALALSQTSAIIEQTEAELPQDLSTPIQQAAIRAKIITPTPGNEVSSEQLPILLPASPIHSSGLPSFASVEEAPTHNNQPIEDQPQRLIIPQIGIDASISRVRLISNDVDGHRYFQWTVPDGYEVGWHETSAPLGQPGNTVLNGHNNVYGAVFRDLIDLELGEEIILYDADGPYHYQVTQREILPENDQPLSTRLENARWIEQTADERITIISCWPYATNSNRLVVIAEPLKS